jgi:hypothetical protein
MSQDRKCDLYKFKVRQAVKSVIADIRKHY